MTQLLESMPPCKSLSMKIPTPFDSAEASLVAGSRISSIEELNAMLWNAAKLSPEPSAAQAGLGLGKGHDSGHVEWRESHRVLAPFPKAQPAREIFLLPGSGFKRSQTSR